MLRMALQTRSSQAHPFFSNIFPLYYLAPGRIQEWTCKGQISVWCRELRIVLSLPYAVLTHSFCWVGFILHVYCTQRENQDHTRGCTVHMVLSPNQAGEGVCTKHGKSC